MQMKSPVTFRSQIAQFAVAFVYSYSKHQARVCEFELGKRKRTMTYRILLHDCCLQKQPSPLHALSQSRVECIGASKSGLYFKLYNVFAAKLRKYLRQLR